jgi:hypothetical protein
MWGAQGRGLELVDVSGRKVMWQEETPSQGGAVRFLETMELTV